MEFHLPDNIQKEKRRKRKAIPQIAYSTQNKTEEGRYFNDTSNTIKNPENWKDSLVTKDDLANGDVVIPDSRPYKVYTALVTQNNTDNPIPTILENTLGYTPSWTRTGTGTYDLLFSSSTVESKTIVFSSSISPEITFKVLKFFSVPGIRVFRFTSYLNNIASDNQLSSLILEIRVYN